MRGQKQCFTTYTPNLLQTIFTSILTLPTLSPEYPHLTDKTFFQSPHIPFRTHFPSRTLYILSESAIKGNQERFRICQAKIRLLYQLKLEKREDKVVGIPKKPNFIPFITRAYPFLPKIRRLSLYKIPIFLKIDLFIFETRLPDL